MREACSFTDFFVISTARNPRQARGVADEIKHAMKHERSTLPRGAVGEREGTWIVLDYLDVVTHVFTNEARQFYALEDLWSDVPVLDVALTSGGLAPQA
jgi:ribosome-associated protein